MVNQQITLLLEQEGYSPQRVDSRIHTTSEGSIEITELNLWMPGVGEKPGKCDSADFGPNKRDWNRLR